MWLLLIAGVGWLMSQSAEVDFSKADAREAGCRLIAAWKQGAGADLAELDPETLAGMILEALITSETWGKLSEADKTRLGEKAGRIAVELLEQGGCGG